MRILKDKKLMKEEINIEMIIFLESTEVFKNKRVSQEISLFHRAF